LLFVALFFTFFPNPRNMPFLSLADI
jgi:hypothetical protein